MTEPNPQLPPGARRREAELAALEAAIVAAVTGILAHQVGRAIGTLRTGWRIAAGQGPQWAAARRAVAADLRRIRPSLARPIERTLPRAAALGARHVDAPLPARHDPAAGERVGQVLDSLDATVRGKLQAAAEHIATDPIATEPQLAAAVDRTDAAVSAAQAGAGDAVAAAAAEGSAAAADGADLDLVWVSERDACLSCLSMAGSVRTPGGLFRPLQDLAPRIIPWLPGGIVAPPAHGHCRCRAEVATEGLSDALAREAQRTVARGDTGYASGPERLRAIDLLLRSGATRLPATVRRKAAEDLARGRLSSRDLRRAG